MFPCKVKIDQLDKTNKKVKDVDIKANKALTKGKIKKVASQEGERTPFYYLADYFEQNGKPVGHFLSLGNSLKLEKHFVQNEMKKSKSSLMGEKLQDPKKAAMGEVYVEKNVIYFEPHDKCKVPEAKWPKILKEMKEYFSGMKAVVIINGEVLAEDEDDSLSDDKTGDSEVNSMNIDAVKKQVQQLLGQFKELEPNKAFKGLGLIHSINNLIGQLDEVPENLKVLAKKLEAQQTKITPVFSKQIDQKLGQSIGKLEEIPSVNSSEELDDIFGTVQKMYKGWKTFLPETEHPKGAIIEKVSDEVTILKDYEGQIVPLRKKYEGMEDSEEKEQLGDQINTLINEARTALA